MRAFCPTRPPATRASSGGIGAGGGGGVVVGPDTSIVNGMAVPVSGTSIATSFLLADETSGSRLVVSLASDFSSPIYSSYANTTSKTAKHIIAGLSPATEYYYTLEINGEIKTGTTRQCFTAPPSSGYAPFSIAFGSCASGSGASDKTLVLSGFCDELVTPPRLYINLGDLTYTNPSGTTAASYEAVFDQGLAGAHHGKIVRRMGTIYQFDDHDWHLNNSSEFCSQDINTVGLPYIALPQADLVVAGEVHRRRNPIPESLREVATPDGKNNSFAVSYGPMHIIVCDTRSRKVWECAMTVSGAHVSTTSLQVIAALSSSQSNNKPFPGYTLETRSGVPAGTKIVSWASTPTGTGNLTYNLTLDTPVTLSDGTAIKTTSQQLGPEQLQFVKDEIDYAIANDLDILFAWPNGMEWSGWQDNYAYAMDGQKAEAVDLFNYFVATGWNKRTIFICGDIHSTQVGDGFYVDFSEYGRTMIPAWRVGPLEASEFVFNNQGEYDIFNCANTPTQLSCAGHITVEDNGDGTRTYLLQGYHADRVGAVADTFEPIADCTHELVLPQASLDPFGNGVSVVQTWQRPGYARTVPISFTLLEQPTEGNLMVVIVTQYPTDFVNGTAGDGWTLRQTFYSSSGVASFVLTKIAGASESQTVSMGTFAPSGTALSVVFVELESDFGWHASLVNTTGHSAYTGSSVSTREITLTTTADNCAVLCFVGMDSGGALGTATGMSRLIANPPPVRGRNIVFGADAVTAGDLVLSKTGMGGSQHLCAIAFRKADPPAPVFTLHPASQIITDGDPVTFSAAATGAAPLSYQWQVSINDGADWSDVSGETGTSYTLSAVELADDGYQYRVQVTTSQGGVGVSDVATLTVISAGVAAVGGTVTESGGYKIHTFNSADDFILAGGDLEVEYLIVGGGGAGGAGQKGVNNGSAGGGGAGELITGTVTLTPGTYSVVVGTGGVGSSTRGSHTSGGTSSFNSISMLGGGRGGDYDNGTGSNVSSGGSGGGGAGSRTGSGTFTGASAGAGSGSKNAGGSGRSDPGETSRNGGGGGGSGGVGGNATASVAGTGGTGTASSLSGASVTYAAGGAGGSNSVSSGADASANTGNGGEGGGTAGTNTFAFAGGDGGSGIVIVRYPL